MIDLRSRRRFLQVMLATGSANLLGGTSRSAHARDPLDSGQGPYRRDLTLPELFSTASPWRQRVDALSPLSENEERTRAVFEILREYSLLTLAGEVPDTPIGQSNRISRRLTLIHDHGGQAQVPFVSVNEFAFPIAEADTSTVSALPLRQYNGEEGFADDSNQTERRDGQLVALNIPQPISIVRPGGPRTSDADGNVVLIDVQSGTAYDFWQATTAVDAMEISRGGGIPGERILAAGAVSAYAMDGLGAKVPGGTVHGGGRASGLTYLGGMLVPEDLASGNDSVIKHALAFGLPRLRNLPQPNPHDLPNHVYPADRTETTAFSNNLYAMAAGERIRLKPFPQIRGMRFVNPTRREEGRVPLDTAKLAPITRIFLTALQQYGAYLVDGAGAFGFASEDFRTARVNLTDTQVEELIDAPYPNPELPDETKWEAIVNTLNDQFCCGLFADPQIGFPFATDFLLATPFNSTFYSNFDIIPSPMPPVP